ncbi:hypothetical protein EDB19DRAFT_1906792 [Suillus lakei]|nr:hypothetical protein EDB19DRAFT_1906792 [Suillus lakei]
MSAGQVCCSTQTCSGTPRTSILVRSEIKGMYSGKGHSAQAEAEPFLVHPTPVHLQWGSPQFIGLRFLSFMSIILTELFSSPFLKNVSIIIGLVVGCVIAGAVGYIDGSTITSAPTITFLWVHQFKINVNPPAILPMLAVYMAMEAIGDITASVEVSRIPVVGEDFNSRIQGGLLSDGIDGIIAPLLTITTLSLFAAENERDVEASFSAKGEEGLILTGTQHAALLDDQDAYKDAIDRCIIFAKLSPYQKFEVVKALCMGDGGRADGVIEGRITASFYMEH